MTKIEKTIELARKTKKCPFCGNKLYFGGNRQAWNCINYPNSNLLCPGFQIIWGNNFSLLNYFLFNFMEEEFGAFFNFDTHIKRMYIRIAGMKEYDINSKSFDIKEIENLDLLDLPKYLKRKIKLIKLLG